jgi:hypothetical protein
LRETSRIPSVKRFEKLYQIILVKICNFPSWKVATPIRAGVSFNRVKAFYPLPRWKRQFLQPVETSSAFLTVLPPVKPIV